MFVMIDLIFFPFLKDGTTALLKAAIKGYNNVIEELLKFSLQCDRRVTEIFSHSWSAEG